jgi:hypothetical protein
VRGEELQRRQEQAIQQRQKVLQRQERQEQRLEEAAALMEADEAQLTPYERERRANIARNQQMLAALGLVQGGFVRPGDDGAGSSAMHAEMGGGGDSDEDNVPPGGDDSDD